MLNLVQLRVLEAVARHESVTEAAKASPLWARYIV